MIVEAWRIFKPKHRADAFTGSGAAQFGGRWNSKGTPVLYVAASRALAALEMLVHLGTEEVLSRYFLVRVAFDDSLVSRLSVDDLPRTWRRDPTPKSLQALGDRWVRKRVSAVLRVPSAIVPDEHNYLLNPAHADFNQIEIGEPIRWQFDRRLI